MIDIWWSRRRSKLMIVSKSINKMTIRMKILDIMHLKCPISLTFYSKPCIIKGRLRSSKSCLTPKSLPKNGLNELNRLFCPKIFLQHTKLSFFWCLEIPFKWFWYIRIKFNNSHLSVFVAFKRKSSLRNV